VTPGTREPAEVSGLLYQPIPPALLARSGVELVHLRNVGYGCYNFAVRANTV
jgi:hypothetical protein